jgi:hypothetical protein
MVRVLPQDDTRFITFPSFVSFLSCLSSFLELLLLIKAQFYATDCLCVQPPGCCNVESEKQCWRAKRNFTSMLCSALEEKASSKTIL